MLRGEQHKRQRSSGGSRRQHDCGLGAVVPIPLTPGEEYGTDIDDVLHGISLDPRIGDQYMRPGLGFGGSCLPKELKALAVTGGDRGLGMHVTRAASDANAAQQERFADRIEAAAGPVAGRRVALLGLAFKAGTDDVRDSPALAVARTLLARGADLRAHDPAAAENAVRELPDLVTVASPRAALDDAEIAVIATEWPVYRDLDWADARGRMAGDLIVDGRRLLDRDLIRSIGFRYVAVGRATALDSGQQGGSRASVPAAAAVSPTPAPSPTP